MRDSTIRRFSSPPLNAYTVSCVPWLSFEHFAVHSYECKPYFFPSIEAGRYSREKKTGLKDGKAHPVRAGVHKAGTATAVCAAVAVLVSE